MSTTSLDRPCVAIIVPCFNEEQLIGDTARHLTAIITEMVSDARVDSASFIYFVDDGSCDRTWSLIKAMHESDPRIRGLRLSRNFGQQSAILAGLMKVRNETDCAISIDADLQQDESVIPLFVTKYCEGAEIVLGVRRDRATDPFMKRVTALLFYRIMNLMGTRLVENHADCRLLGRKALEALAEYRENNLFLRGIITELGFRTDQVIVDVRERHAGVSKYSVAHMLELAFDGITSFSAVPLRLITALGFLVFLLSVAMMGFVFFARLFLSGIVPGWASTVLPVYFIGGIQMMCIGVVGEYIGKTFKEVKARPRFIVDAEL
jgi:polyisoprenyl-phosphate glycosyltransferase